MGVRTSFPNINYVFGFLHQNWSDFYNWEGREPTFQPIIRYFKTTEEIETINKLIDQLAEFLALPLGEEEFERIVVEEFGSELTALVHGFNRRQFLEDSLKILKESAEETKKLLFQTTSAIGN